MVRTPHPTFATVPGGGYEPDHPGHWDGIHGFSFGLLGWVSPLLLLLLVPLWALMAFLIITGRSRYVEYFFVFSVHCQVVFFLVVGGTGVLAALVVRAGVPWLAPPRLVEGLVILFIHLLRALRVAFSLQGPRLVLATGALFLLHFGGAQLLQNLM